MHISCLAWSQLEVAFDSVELSPYGELIYKDVIWSGGQMFRWFLLCIMLLLSKTGTQDINQNGRPRWC